MDFDAINDPTTQKKMMQHHDRLCTYTCFNEDCHWLVRICLGTVSIGNLSPWSLYAIWVMVLVWVAHIVWGGPELDMDWASNLVWTPSASMAFSMCFLILSEVTRHVLLYIYSDDKLLVRLLQDSTRQACMTTPKRIVTYVRVRWRMDAWAGSDPN
jgi:hypothetical protein